MKKLIIILMVLVGLVGCKKDEVVTLSVDKTEIQADGKDIATFTVKSNDNVVSDALVYFANTNEALHGYTFATKEAGEYVFYAKRNDFKSETITIKAIEVEVEDENEGNDSTTVVDSLKVTLLADNTTLFVGDSVTFTVKNNEVDVTASSEIYNAADDKKLEKNKFSTTTAGTYSFYAKYENVKSENIKIVFKEIEGEDGGEEGDENVSDKPIILSASEKNLGADGAQKTVFTVKQDNVDVTSKCIIYNATDNTELESNEFATTTPGTYKFYAKLGEIKSNSVEIVFNEVKLEPATLSASRYSIGANGTQKTVFTVRHNGVDVTAQSEIFNAADNTKLESNEFSTTTIGTFTFYAMWKEMKTNEITITSREVGVGKSEVFVPGVSKESGWYDVNKEGAGDTNGDMSLCWAAASSNILQWWQDRYVAAGNTLPEGTPNGPGRVYELSIFDKAFYGEDKWTTVGGGWTNSGVIWYLEGSNITASNGAQPVLPGGYFKSVWEDIQANTYQGYTNGLTGEYNHYYIWGNGSNLPTNEDKLRKFTELIVEFIDRGPVGMAVYPGGSAAFHTVTIWGYEIDNETGLLTRIWTTDDGDSKYEPKDQVLNEYTVDFSEVRVNTSRFGLPHFTNTDNTVWYGESWGAIIYPVAGYGSK